MGATAEVSEHTPACMRRARVVARHDTLATLGIPARVLNGNLLVDAHATATTQRLLAWFTEFLPVDRKKISHPRTTD